MICAKRLSELDLSDCEVVKRSECCGEYREEPEKDAGEERLAGAMMFDFGRPSKVSFDKGCLEAIGNPEYVQVLIHLDMKILLLAKAEKPIKRTKGPQGFRVKKDDNGAFTMEHCDAFLSKVTEMMGWLPGRATKMFFAGEVHGDRIAFRLFDAVMFISGDTDELAEYIEKNSDGLTTV